MSNILQIFKDNSELFVNFDIKKWQTFTNNLFSLYNNIIDSRMNISNYCDYYKPYYFANKSYKDILLKNVCEINIDLIKVEILIDLYHNNRINCSIYETKLIHALIDIIKVYKHILDNDLLDNIKLWVKYLFTIKSKSFDSKVNEYLHNFYNSIIQTYNVYQILDNIIITDDINLIQLIKRTFNVYYIIECDCIINDINKYILFKDSSMIKIVGY